MPPTLRSASRPPSNNSRQSTPLDAPVTSKRSSSFTEPARPSKRRRTGRNARVATEPPQDSLANNAEDISKSAATLGPNMKFPGDPPAWVEPPLRSPAPSYADTPWSAVSNAANPILATMRPLGSMPTAADLRKAGLKPTKPSKPITSLAKELLALQNDMSQNDEPMSQNEETPASLNPPTPASQSETPKLSQSEALQSPQNVNLQALPNGRIDAQTPQEAATPADKTHSEGSKPCSYEEIDALLALPVCNSVKLDLEKTRDAVKETLRMASDTNNSKVVKSLFNLWTKATQDPMVMSVVHGMCKKEILDPQTSAPTTVPTPIVAADATRSKLRSKGKQAKVNATKAANKDKSRQTRQSALPSSDLRKRVLEDDTEFSEEAIRAKRQRLRQPLPDIVPDESGIRSTLSYEQPGGALSPLPSSIDEAQIAPEAPLLNGREQSESAESSGAEDNRRLTPTFSREGSLDNSDLCRECGGRGQLLCCDGCVNSFHFSCLEPPLDPANPPEGDWFCPKCSVSRPIRKMVDKLDRLANKEFMLPASIRNHFAGVKTGSRPEDKNDRTRYTECSYNLVNGVGRGVCNGFYDDPNLRKITDSDGNLIICYACGRPSDGDKPILQCDFCHLNWHMDCLDPPMAKPPQQENKSDKRWRCPMHVEHEMYYYHWNDEGAYDARKIRRPARPRMIDIEILPSEEESERIENEEDVGGGILYRVSEKGVEAAFLAKVKRENAEFEYNKQQADKYFEEARAQRDELHARAVEFYAAQQPRPLPDAAEAIDNSRSAADREAAKNLLAFAAQNQTEPADDNSRITFLIDALRAQAPNDLPEAHTEIESLRNLQQLIERRIQALSSQTELEATTAQVSEAASSPIPNFAIEHGSNMDEPVEATSA
ncbi:PHD finger domain-containing protein, putative [Aspergillus fumigatus Z5]|nr:PHD finger domain-containing protein, putative [Aspergillus fumigatus Z5]